MNRVKRDLQTQRSHRTLGFRPDHQAAEAHVAVAQALAYGKKYEAKVAVAKGRL